MSCLRAGLWLAPASASVRVRPCLGPYSNPRRGSFDLSEPFRCAPPCRERAGPSTTHWHNSKSTAVRLARTTCVLMCTHRSVARITLQADLCRDVNGRWLLLRERGNGDRYTNDNDQQTTGIHGFNCSHF